MSTQLNLLPDVKLEYLRSSRQKRLVVAAALLLSALSIGVLLMLGSIAYVFQKKSVSNLDNDIKTYTNQLEQIPDLNKVLTVQNQLNSLPALHQQKPQASRVFGYLTKLTPTDANISQFDADFDKYTMTITGTAKSLDVANTFIDTLKFTTYSAKGTETSTSGTKAFSKVVMSQFTRNATQANYTITLEFDPVIFDNRSEIEMSVPKIISTRSATEQPATDLFQKAPEAPTTNTTAPSTTGAKQ